MAYQSIITELTAKGENGEMTALDNQLAKLSTKELEVYVALNEKGIEGEDALSFILTASSINLI